MLVKRHNLRARLHGVGRAVLTHGRRAVAALDKGADFGYRFLSHLDPAAVTAVAGEKTTQRLQQLHGGLERYEQVRHRIAGPRNCPSAAEEVD